MFENLPSRDEQTTRSFTKITLLRPSRCQHLPFDQKKETFKLKKEKQTPTTEFFQQRNKIISTPEICPNTNRPFGTLEMEAIFPTNNLLAQTILGSGMGSTRSPRRNPLRPVQGNVLQNSRGLGGAKAFNSPSKQVLLR